MPDVWHTVFGLAGLSMLGFRGLDQIDPIFCMPARFTKALVLQSSAQPNWPKDGTIGRLPRLKETFSMSMQDPAMLLHRVPMRNAYFSVINAKIDTNDLWFIQQEKLVKIIKDIFWLRMNVIMTGVWEIFSTQKWAFLMDTFWGSIPGLTLRVKQREMLQQKHSKPPWNQHIVCKVQGGQSRLQ